MHRLNEAAELVRPSAVFPPPGERAPAQLSPAPRFGGGEELNSAPKRGSADGGPSKASHPPSTELVRLLSLLADKTRLRILRILADGERPVVSLTAELKLPQPTVSHHLAWLRMMDLVSPRRQGKNVFYALGRAARYDTDGTMILTAMGATVTFRTTSQEGA
jgi:ArsR family transcriptional regulator